MSDSSGLVGRLSTDENPPPNPKSTSSLGYNLEELEVSIEVEVFNPWHF